jgi:uroporphyrinogen decarboxylase
LEEIAETGCDAVGLDWTVNLGRARARIGDRCALQGNLDPMALFAPADAIRAQAARVIDSFGRPQNADGTWAGHVFNLSHGISQFTPPESVAILVDAVHAHSRTLRA